MRGASSWSPDSVESDAVSDSTSDSKAVSDSTSDSDERGREGRLRLRVPRGGDRRAGRRAFTQGAKAPGEMSAIQKTSRRTTVASPRPTSRKRSTQRSPPVAPTSRKRSTQRSPPVASTRTFLLREGTNAGEPPPPPPRPPSSAPASPLLRPPKVLTRAKRRTGGFLSSEAPGVRPLCFVGGVGGSFRVSLSDAIPIPSRGVAMPTPSAPTALCESRSRSACSAAAPVVRGRRRLRASVAPGLYVRRRDPPPAARARPRGRRGVGHGASARTSP
uniref:Uncharacterized protein n=1 Tax=Human herpesvirus 1 TaxID=10298 RepID=A0A2U9ABD6_HHV1|nr:hypothetical protein [Human alphaherpesvirus 1]AWO71806.1 hypothetical protein [Human alphaherpesvirus 1]